jgi:hypothetical protein
MARPAEADRDQSRLWLPLLRRLTDEASTWAVWKNVEAALAGSGDLDCAAPRSLWPLIEDEVATWAVRHSLGPVVSCRHVPGALFVIAVDPSRSLFHQLDIRARTTFRGATVFRAEDLSPLVEIDPRGFRRLRPGAEGLFKLVINGTGRAGAPRPDALAKEEVAGLLARDPSGAREAASLFGLVRGAVLQGAQQAAMGQWDRAAMCRVDAWARVKALMHPKVLVGQVAVRRAKRTCPILRTSIQNARRIPGDIAGWVTAVTTTHKRYGF